MLLPVRWLALTLLMVTAGCASIDFDAPKPASYAISDETDSHLMKLIAPDSYNHPGQSGFHLLRDGIDALAARVAMARLAEHSVDAQYYLIYDDPVGYIFLSALLEAADRGVRVRLLVDDFLTKGTDPGLVALDTHPNFEVRLFNPLAYRSLRSLNLPSFSRINRRMHNKSFIADNQLAIVGGRNIGEEYFAAASDVNFGDLDILTGGPLVTDTSRMFDKYWNHRKAVPASSVIRPPDDPQLALDNLRRQAREAIDRLRNTPWADAAVASYENYLHDREQALGWGPAELIYDSPDKALRSEAGNAENSMVTNLRTAAFGADQELIIVSPYFVPSKNVMQALAERVDAGVKVYVITNSLAANNHTLVHSGYAPKRKPMLESGVKIYEVKPDAERVVAREWGLGASNSTLHTKGFLVDDELFFIGSYNWDPRSNHLNTEMGALILQQELVEEVRKLLQSKLDHETYEVILEDGKLRWLDRQGEDVKIWKKEPETGFWRRTWSGFLGLFPLDSQL